MTLSFFPLFFGLGPFHQSCDHHAPLNVVGHADIQNMKIHLRDDQTLPMMLDVMDELAQIEHTVRRIEIDLDRDPSERIDIFWVQDSETPDGNPVCLRKFLYDLLKIGCSKLTGVSGDTGFWMVC